MPRIALAKKDRETVVSREALIDRVRLYSEFHRVYEGLVEVLCDGAQFGATPKLEKEYYELRRQMQATYPAVRPFVISFLEYVPNDLEAGLKLRGRPLDAFEVLVAAADLREFFDTDDGNMISRLTRTREALTAYGDHLRLLSARIA